MLHHNKQKNLKKGMTYVEIILYVAIVTVFLGGLVAFVMNAVYGQVKSQAQQAVSDNLRLASSRISYEIRNAIAVNNVTPTAISLQMDDSARNPTIIDLNNGRIRIGYGNSGTCTAASPCFLTSNDVNFTTLDFEDLTGLGTASIIKYSLNVDFITTSLNQAYEYSDSFSSSARIRGE